MRPGASPNFVIYLQGGGWCYDQNCDDPTRAGTLTDCRSRSQSSLGSSSSWSSSYSGWGILSSSASQNPVFHNWTSIYVPYCDGASFTGNTEVDGLHFRGGAILSAILEELKATTNIVNADQVVLSGGSAGASAVLYHVDSVAEQLALTTGEVLGLPDAGFFLDLPDRNGVDCWPGQMRSLYNVTGYSGLHTGCLARFPQEQWKCLFPEYYGDLIASRMFILNSYYDSSELTYTLRINCNPSQCSGRQANLFQQMKPQHQAAWASIVNKTDSGVWAIACVDHTLNGYQWTNSDWTVPANSGNTMATAVERWLARNNADGKNYVHEDAVAYPNNGPCSSAEG